MIDIIFVPLWLERHLKSLGVSVSSLRDTSALGDILSPVDVKNYVASKLYFDQKYLVPMELAKNVPEYNDVLYELDDASIIKHLYGSFYFGSNNTITPEFNVNVIGDAVYITIDMQGDDGVNAKCSGEVPTLPANIIKAIASFTPIKEIASRPIFRDFIKTLV